MQIKHFKTVVFTCTLVGLFGCSAEIKKSSIIPSVKIEQLVQSKQIGTSIRIPASVNELSETKLSFRVGGPLVYLNEVIGCKVKTGDVIAKIDSRDFELAVSATESRYLLAKAEYERYKNLLDKQSVSKSVFDQMENGYRLAKTDYDNALNALEDTEIKAPFTGSINRVFVNNYEMVSPGQAITSIMDISTFEVNSWISIEDAALIDKTTAFTCIVKQGGSEYLIPGKLKELGSKTSISKQSLPLSIIINATNEVKLCAGMTGYIKIEFKQNATSLAQKIPLSSVFTKNQQSFVWVYNDKDSTISSKQVVTGQLDQNNTIEITKGLIGREKIVTAGTHFVFEGQKVKILAKSSKSNVGNKL